ncbi:MAG: hypothetical protein A07HB70_00136, partial [uncultured archaeon A07HB70]
MGASVGTLAAVDPSAADSPPDADAHAETVATTTATVNYTLAPSARRAADTGVAFPRTEGP